MLFRGQEPRNPVQEIPVGNCTLLFGDLGAFIFLVRKILTRLIAILLLGVFFVRENRRSIPHMEISDLICLN